MTQNPYFYVMLSFVLALIVGYKKIWPPLNLAIQDEISHLKEEFHKIDTMQYTLELTLKTLKKEENKHRFHCLLDRWVCFARRRVVRMLLRSHVLLQI